MNTMEGGSNIEKKYKVVPAQDNKFFKNCIVIESGAKLSAGEIMRLARENDAFEEDVDDAPDDSCLVQFPGHGQEVLTHDGLLARLRGLNGEGKGE